MNALTRDLIKLVDMTEEMMKEKEQKEGADYREKLHLMPHFFSILHLMPKAA